MANSKSNWPTAQDIRAEPGEISAIVDKMETLREMSRPKTDAEIEERVKWYFQWCIDNDLRPGVEQLALALGTTRQSLWNWQREGSRRGEIITEAKQVIASFLESVGVSGKLNPATFCFLMKNNFGYADNIALEVDTPNTERRISTAADIAARHLETSLDDPGELPKLPPDLLLSDN